MPLTATDFNSYLNEYKNTNEGAQLVNDQTIGFINDKLAFFEVKAESVGDKRSAYEQKYPIYKKWEGYLEDYRTNSPASLKSGVQTGGVFWCWMESERAFLDTAVYGMTIAIGFSFLILLFATRNIILALLAILSVGIVIVSVVAIMVLKEWELGVSESISVVILIGLSVDYVVHLAADYNHSVKETRFEKIE